MTPQIGLSMFVACRITDHEQRLISRRDRELLQLSAMYDADSRLGRMGANTGEFIFLTFMFSGVQTLGVRTIILIGHGEADQSSTVCKYSLAEDNRTFH